MTERTVLLTEDEAEALAEILSMLATMEERAIGPNGVLEVSRELWNDTLVRPARRLSRLRVKALSSGE